MASTASAGWGKRLEDLPRKAAAAIKGTLADPCTTGGCAFESPPRVYGYMPRVNNYGTIKIGRQCIFRSFRIVINLGVQPGGSLELGDNSFLNDGVNICAGVSIKIGNSVKIGIWFVSSIPTFTPSHRIYRPRKNQFPSVTMFGSGRTP